MSDLAISVRDLSKRYRLGLKEERPDTFVKAALSWAKSPLANYRRLRRLNHFDDDSNRCSNGHPRDILYALKNVSFDIKQGEVVGIIGRNGAGKSTLLKILSRVTEPTRGRVEIFGRVASLLEVGTGFHPELTGRENIYLNGTMLGMRKRELDGKLDEIVAFGEIEPFLDTPVKRYSSGMYVRLAFAVAAHLDPEILIVDEVLAVGDGAFQQKCLGKIKSASSTLGRTVLLVTHQLSVAREICSRGLLLEQGVLSADAPAGQVIARYVGAPTEVSLRAAKYITNIEIFSERDNPPERAQVVFGGTLRISVHLRNLPPLVLGCNLGIRNCSGRLICLFSTNPHDGVSLPRCSELRITCEIDCCHLAPGLYTVDVALSEPAVRILEEVACSSRFEVLPKRVGGYWPYEPRFGDYFPPHRWRLTEANQA
jgi:ABC-type polysaccharide/polyol phosphate transport system ATPase subunit